MPTYEFRCSDCDVLFEERRPASRLDDPAPPCPSGHTATRRVLSVFAAVGSSASGASSSSVPTGGCGAGCACSCGA